MENSNEKPQGPLSQKELDALYKLTQKGNDKEVDEDYRPNLINKIFKYSDIDKDRLNTLTTDRLEFIYDMLKLDHVDDNATPDFYALLENSTKIRDLIAKMERDDI